MKTLDAQEARNLVVSAVKVAPQLPRCRHGAQSLWKVSNEAINEVNLLKSVVDILAVDFVVKSCRVLGAVLVSFVKYCRMSILPFDVNAPKLAS